MAGERYVPITHTEMADLLERDMGFHRADESTCWEMIWVRDVETRSGQKFPYQVKVYSTIDLRTRVTRECGQDAIRLVLIDTITGRPVKKADKRVFRTMNALINLRKRARDLFKYVIEGPHCPKCSSVMVKRTGGPGNHEFWGCSHYAPNNPWHCTGTRQLEQAAA